MDLLNIFLQINPTDSLGNPSLISGATESVSLFELALKGGYIMIVLGILAIIAIYVFVERMTVIKKAQVAPQHLLEKVKTAVLDGDIEMARAVCLKDGTPMAKMLIQGLEHIGSSLKNIEVLLKIQVN